MSCQQEEFTEPPQTEDEFLVEVNFKSENSINENTATRTLNPSQEADVKDINLYMFHKTTGICVKRYISGATTLLLSLIKGEYDVYAIANHGSDMGNKTKPDMERFEFSTVSESALEKNSALPMSAKTSVNIPDGRSIRLLLTRAVAKIDAQVNVVAGFNFAVQYMEVVNAPRCCRAFSQNSSLSAIKYPSRNSRSMSFYLFENYQGINSSITTEQQKNIHSAPQLATYIHIVGTTNGKKVEYSIFLGENNTSNFNVVRNKNYSYLINLKGVNDYDSRLNVASLEVMPFKSTYLVGQTANTSISLSCTENSSNNYSILLKRIQGSGSWMVNGAIYQENSPYMFLPSGQTFKTVPFTYTQNTASPVRILLTMKDNNNVTFTRELVTEFKEMQTIKISVKYANLSNKTIDIWCEASAPVASTLTVDVYLLAALISHGGTLSRGANFYPVLTFTNSSTKSNVQNLSITPNADNSGIQVGRDMPTIRALSKTSDLNGLINYVK